MTYLEDHYKKVIRADLKKEFSYSNDFMIPKLEKIVLNMGVGDAVADKKKVEAAARDLTVIAGQKSVITKAKNSIATYKLRQGMPIGTTVTLRQHRMYEFLFRLIYIAMPRIRDFRGLLPKSFDGHGNYAMGIREHIIFPEVDYNQVEKSRGLDVVFVTSAKTNAEAYALLKGFNLPFTK